MSISSCNAMMGWKPHIFLVIVTCERGDGDGVGEGRGEAKRFGAGTERGLPARRGGKGLRVTTDWGRPCERVTYYAYGEYYGTFKASR